MDKYRNYGDAPFRQGDVDVAAFRTCLAKGREVDKVIEEVLRSQGIQGSEISEIQLISVLNEVVETVDFMTRFTLDLDALQPHLKKLIEVTSNAIKLRLKLSPGVLKTTNRALIHLYYPEATTRQRMFNRIAALSIGKAAVQLQAYPPHEGTYPGHLVNLSAGGVALFLHKKIEIGARFKLNMTLPDHTVLETDVRVAHSLSKKPPYEHGIEFLSLPDYMHAKYNKMAEDFLACEERIQTNTEPVCDLQCKFYLMCEKDQKIREPNVDRDKSEESED